MLSVVAIKSLTTYLGTTKLSLSSLIKSSTSKKRKREKKQINKNMFLGQVSFGYSWSLTIAIKDFKRMKGVQCPRTWELQLTLRDAPTFTINFECQVA
jgi:hypothetical protein